MILRKYLNKELRLEWLLIAKIDIVSISTDGMGNVLQTSIVHLNTVWRDYFKYWKADFKFMLKVFLLSL